MARTKKWASSEQKRKAEELAKEWITIIAKYPPPATKGKLITKINKPKIPPGRETPRIPSKQDIVLGAITSKQSMKYTGTKILGIGTMHKSNAVPIFNDDEAKAISSMRR